MSISNQGTSPAFSGVTRQVDTITLNSATPAALSKKGIVSYPAFETQGASPTADVITVYDTTTSHPLVLGTDYTLTPSGSGATLSYAVTRLAGSTQSANADSATVSYYYGTIPDTENAPGFAGAAPTGTQSRGSVADTTGQSVAGPGAALPGGSTTDPAGLASRAGSETGSPGSEYTSPRATPSTYGWTPGQPDTEGVYGPNLPSAYTPSQNLVGSAGVIDTTIGGGAVRTDATPSYRAPGTTVAGANRDTSLTDLLGNMLSAQPVTGTAYAAAVIDTSYAGAPSAPSGISTQTDTITNGQTATAYYASQSGVVPSSLVVAQAGVPAVQGTDYSVAVSGAGAKTTLSVTRIGGTVLTVGGTWTLTYNYGSPTYWESNVPAAPPAAPPIGTATAANRGIALTWTPPAGQTELDFYQIECSDMGTMFVPYTGQPKFYGQPSPSGGGETGSPAYQSDSFAFAAFPATLSKTGVLTPAGQLIVRDSTQGLVLRYGYDYTVTQIGAGPTLTYQVALVAGGGIARAGDTITIGYFWSNLATISATYTQGMYENIPVIYKPDGTTPYSQGYRFRVAAGNRRGLSAFSAWSNYAVPLNYNAPQPGHEGQTQTELALDPANAVNPIYKPDGTVKAGTGLGG